MAGLLPGSGRGATGRTQHMRDVTLLGARLVLGGYLAVHGAQKLFGAFGGSGLEKTGAGSIRPVSYCRRAA